MRLAAALCQDPVKVKVIVPGYNAADYVRQCVESILGQRFAEFELRVVRNPRDLGVAGARNRATPARQLAPSDS